MRTGYDEEIAKGDMRNLVLGGSVLPREEHRLVLRGKQLKELAAQIDDDDSVVIKRWTERTYEPDHESHYQRISIIRGVKDES